MLLGVIGFAVVIFVYLVLKITDKKTAKNAHKEA